MQSVNESSWMLFEGGLARPLELKFEYIYSITHCACQMHTQISEGRVACRHQGPWGGLHVFQVPVEHD